MGLIEPGHLVLILLIALIVFGPGRFGDLGGTLGRGLRDFRDATEGKTPATPELSAAGYCAACGAALATESKFCPACGKGRRGYGLATGRSPARP